MESEEFEQQEKLIEVESEKEEQVKLVEQLKQGVSVTSEKLKKAEDELARQASESRR